MSPVDGIQYSDQQVGSLCLPVKPEAIDIRAVLDLFFPIRPEPDFAGFGMTNPAGDGAGFSN